MKSVLIVGYFGCGNLGDELTLSIIRRELFSSGIKYKVLTARSRLATAARVPLLYGMIRESSAVLMCGGNLLQNETGNRSLFYYLHIIETAKRIGVPVLFASSGIGEIKGFRELKFTKNAICGIDFFGARTFEDFTFITELDMGVQISMPDVCFTLPEKRENKEAKFAYIPKGVREDELKKIEWISCKSGCTPIVIPFQPKCERGCAKRIARRLGAPLFELDSYEKISDLLSSCKFTVSDRLHGAILSLLSHTAAFLDSRQHKCRMLIEDIRLRSSHMKISPPLLPDTELCPEKIKELGAQGSEFDILLNGIKGEANAALSKLISRLCINCARN